VVNAIFALVNSYNLNLTKNMKIHRENHMNKTELLKRLTDIEWDDFEAKRDIAKLKAKGIIKRIGPDKGGYWKIIKK